MLYFFCSYRGKLRRGAEGEQEQRREVGDISLGMGEDRRKEKENGKGAVSAGDLSTSADHWGRPLAGRGLGNRLVLD